MIEVVLKMFYLELVLMVIVHRFKTYNEITKITLLVQILDDKLGILVKMERLW
jgi:hypothetical protein